LAGSSLLLGCDVNHSNFRKLFSSPLRNIQMNKSILLASLLAAAALVACGKKEAPAAVEAAPAAASAPVEAASAVASEAAAPASEAASK
jgi:hypothetical protein